MSSNSARRIVVVTNMHTDERGDEVNELLEGVHIPGVELITREVPDWARALRGLDCNPSLRCSGSSRGNRDDRFLNRIYDASKGANLTIDVHFSRNAWSFPIISNLSWHSSNPLVRRAAFMLGSDWVMTHRLAHPAAWIHDYLGLELGTESRFLESEFVWALEALARGWLPEERPLRAYRFTADVMAPMAEVLGLERKYTELEPLPAKLSGELGIKHPLFVALWGPDSYRSGCWGEVVRPEVPLATQPKRRIRHSAYA